MKNRIIILGILVSTGVFSLLAQSYFDDDIYYNPKKENKTVTNVKKEKKSNYIANLGDMDVDSYNRRDHYYVSAADTIGSGIENGEDFVYTQKIQKFYNPTIVVDNADILGDVLANSYGNVDIQINAGGYPVFMPSYAYSWPYYNRWGFRADPWGWSIGFYDPWYPSWSWGPSWAWSPSWAWGPSWSWGPGWGHGWRPGHVHPPYMSWNPNGNRVVGARPGWSSNTRPVYSSSHRVPVSSHRPNASVQQSASSIRNSGSGVVNNNGRWQYVNNGHRVAGTPSSTSNSSAAVTTSRPTTNMTINGHRTAVGSGKSNVSNTKTDRNVTSDKVTNNAKNTTRTYNNNSNNNRSTNRSYNNSGSYNRNTGSFGGGRTGGGNSGGRSTSGGGRHR